MKPTGLHHSMRSWTESLLVLALAICLSCCSNSHVTAPTTAASDTNGNRQIGSSADGDMHLPTVRVEQVDLSDLLATQDADWNLVDAIEKAKQIIGDSVGVQDEQDRLRRCQRARNLLSPWINDPSVPSAEYWTLVGLVGVYMEDFYCATASAEFFSRPNGKIGDPAKIEELSSQMKPFVSQELLTLRRDLIKASAVDVAAAASDPAAALRVGKRYDCGAPPQGRWKTAGQSYFARPDAAAISEASSYMRNVLSATGWTSVGGSDLIALNGMEHVRAVRWYRQAARLHSAEGAFRLAMGYAGVVIRAQAAGDSGAEFPYRSSKNLPPISSSDANAAERLLHAAAGRGYAEAFLCLGDAYYPITYVEGEPMSGFGQLVLGNDIGKSAAWTIEASRAGVSVGPRVFARCLAAIKLGRQKDAIAWAKFGDSLNEAQCTFALAGYYENGTGVTRDLPRAIALYQKAARAGNRDARARLSKMNENW